MVLASHLQRWNGRQEGWWAALNGLRPRPAVSCSLGWLTPVLCSLLPDWSAAARYVDQGGGKRKGAFAVYLEPWHADVFDWL